jgi:hypothetical protein
MEKGDGESGTVPSSWSCAAVETLKVAVPDSFGCGFESAVDSSDRAVKIASGGVPSLVGFGGCPGAVVLSSSAERVSRTGSSLEEARAAAAAPSSSDEEGARLGSCRTCFAYALSFTSWVFPALGYFALRLECNLLRMAALFSSNFTFALGEDASDDASNRAGGTGAREASKAAWKLDHSCGGHGKRKRVPR